MYIRTCPSRLGMCGDVMLERRGVRFTGLGILEYHARTPSAGAGSDRERAELFLLWCSLTQVSVLLPLQ